MGQRKKCLVQQLGRGKCLGSVLDCGCRIKLTVNCTLMQIENLRKCLCSYENNNLKVLYS